jgi:hypothetical protein
MTMTSWRHGGVETIMKRSGRCEPTTLYSLDWRPMRVKGGSYASLAGEGVERGEVTRVDGADRVKGRRASPTLTKLG